MDRRLEQYNLDGIGIVWIRSLTEGELSRALAKTTIPEERIELIKQMVVDENGNRMFRESDDELISSLPAEISAPLYDACNRHLFTMTTAKKN